MSRPGATGQRTLTLPEELEKLEQSITLTLQEIDHNFSRAHRIVTSSILPIVERYAEHSKDVWEGSKFWKQFFEASANVSLNGYEEAPDEEEDQTITTNEEDILSESTPVSKSTSSFMETPGPQTATYAESEEQVSPPPTITPRASRRTPSGSRGGHEGDRDSSPTPSITLPTTPRAQTYTEESTISVDSPELPAFPSTSKKTSATKNQDDILLHRVLDRNYRVQATPMHHGAGHRPAASQPGVGRNAKLETPAANKTGAFNIDLDSSPMEEAPTMQAGLFQSPARKRLSGHKADWESQRGRERVPGVSVLASKQDLDDDIGRVTLSKVARQSLGRGATSGYGAAGAGGWDSDSDDGFDDMSPPKTIAFNLPTNKLMRTPAREASKMIVEDLLATAGGAHMSDLEDSPSIIRKEINYEEDTF